MREEMTAFDEKLLEKARSTKYWDYALVFELIEFAESDDCKYTLNTIGEILFEIYQERGRYDPTKTKNMQRVRGRGLSFFTRFMQKVQHYLQKKA